MSVPSNLGAGAAAADEDTSIACRWGPWLLGTAIAAGVVCRVAQYAADRSFWVDEAALLLNVRSHTVHQLFGPLDYDQAAPPLFMAAERGLLLTLGQSEYALRLLPLACGIGALFLFAALARRVLDSPWDSLAVALFALSDRFIWHGTEVKQYGTDLLVAVLLTYLAIESRNGWSATRRFVVIATAAAVIAWFSYTTMFVFAAISIALFPRGRGRGTAIGPYLMGNAIAGASFLILIGTVIRAQKTGSLTAYWNVEFLNLYHPWSWPWWLARHLHSMCNYPIPGGGPVVLAGMIAGTVWLWRSGKFQMAVILAGPIVVALGAAAVHRYPFDGARLTNFLCGSVLILTTLGSRWGYRAITGWFSRRRGAGPEGESRGGERAGVASAQTSSADGTAPRFARIAGLAPAGYLLIVATASAAMHLVAPRNRGHLRPIVLHMRQVAEPADEICLLNDRRTFLWYWPRAQERERGQFDPADRRRSGRFWIVWSFSNETGKRQAAAILGWAGSFAVKQDQIYSDGGAAVLMARDGRSPSCGGEVPSGIEAVFDVPATAAP